MKAQSGANSGAMTATAQDWLQICLLRQQQGIVNFDAEIAHGAFQLGVPKQ